jgi:nitrogen fixation protein NifU and related proteins
MYSSIVIKRFTNPKNIGELKDFNAFGEAGDINCSDFIEIKVFFEEEIVKNAKFLAYGCPYLISSADIFVDLVKGKEINDALKVSKQEILKHLGNIPKTQKHCLNLAIDAFKMAVENYKNN